MGAFKTFTFGDGDEHIVIPVVKKSCYGFTLHFGSFLGMGNRLFVHHVGDGFDTVEEGARDLVRCLLTDYFYGITDHNRVFSKKFDEILYPTLDDFQRWLKSQPNTLTDTWSGHYWHTKEWEPWDSMRKLYPYLGSFWESEDPAERVLLQFINVEEDVPVEWVDFREELKQYQLKLQKDRAYSFERVVP